MSSVGAITRGTVWALLAAGLTLTSLGASAARPVKAGGSTDGGSSLTVSGTPPTTVLAGESYSFVPSSSGSKGKVGWSISNKPSWASFSISKGTLSGTPGSSQAGAYSNIVISAMDGRGTASLPAFTITVSAAAQTTDPAPVNSAPTIIGTSAAEVLAGQSYWFKPTASDADGDTLSFSIVNRPSWATFNGSTGALSGTPSASQVGTYGNISISVSDGKGGSATLSGFSVAVVQTTNGTATVTWMPPTQNADGTALSDLAGYRIYYGTQPGGPYAGNVTLSNPSLSTYLVENLTAGTYYFVITAQNSAGVESLYSNEASKIIN